MTITAKCSRCGWGIPCICSPEEVMTKNDASAAPGHDMRYMDHLQRVALDAVNLIRTKTLTYGDSWKRRGGQGAWFTLVRPWDRLEKIVAERHQGDIFAAMAADPSAADGSALACVRDMMNYLLLCDAHHRASQGAPAVLQKGEEVLPRPGTPEEAAEAYLTCMRNTFMTGQILKIEGGIAIAN